MTSISARQVRRSGSFDLDCSADTAFPLFSPEGEREWIQEWDPRPVSPSTIVFQPDTVFREGHGKDQAVWTIVDADWQNHRAEYVRLAPESHAARIVVEVEALNQERSRAFVSYTITAWGDRGESLLANFSEHAYQDKMHNWKRLIDGCLRSRSQR